ncbi:hypothetical protein HN51_035883, partial [Arachis hypogaea]
LGNLYKEGEPEPYIGKLIKIWETADKAKKVKVLWYFRPGEIRNFLEGCEVRWNELFLACGDEVGLANLNPLVIGTSLFWYFLFLLLIVVCEVLQCFLEKFAEPDGWELRWLVYKIEVMT